MRIVWAHLCEDMISDDRGRVTIKNVFDSMTFEPPARLFNLGAALQLDADPGSRGSAVLVGLEVFKEAAPDPIFRNEASAQIPARSGLVGGRSGLRLFVSMDGLVVMEAGQYRVRLSLDQAPATELSFRVVGI